MTADMPPVHPAAELFPMMTDDELQALADDILANGLRQPVVMLGGYLLDGRNRWKACQLAGVEPMLRDWSGPDAVSYVRSLNLHRRHLTAAQRAALAVKVEPIYAGAAAERIAQGARKGGMVKAGAETAPGQKRNESARSLAQAAKTAGASLDSAKAMKRVAAQAPEVVELVQRGRVETVAEAQRVAELPCDARAEVVELVAAGRPVKEAFSVAAAMQQQREQRETPIGQVIVVVEAVRRHAVALSGASARAAEMCRRLEVTELRSPEVGRMRISLLEARSEINRAIEALKGGDE